MGSVVASCLAKHLIVRCPMSHDASRELVERYDADAAAYRELWAPVLLSASVTLLESIGGAPPRRILDIGAGVGALLPELRRRFADAEVVGLDRSRGMLRLAPSEMPRVVAEAVHLPLGDGCADLALMVFMLFHVASPLQALCEARRVLRPGGRVATVTWAEEMTCGAGKVWQKCLDALGPPPPASSGHEQVDTSAKVGDLLHSAGFDSVRVWEAGLLTTFGRDEFVKLKTSVGSDKRRLQDLAPPQRERFMAAALAELEGLPSEAFRASGSVVYGVGCRSALPAHSMPAAAAIRSSR